MSPTAMILSAAGAGITVTAGGSIGGLGIGAGGKGCVAQAPSINNAGKTEKRLSREYMFYKNS